MRNTTKPEHIHKSERGHNLSIYVFTALIALFLLNGSVFVVLILVSLANWNLKKKIKQQKSDLSNGER